MEVAGTVLVTVKAASTSAKAAPTSRTRIPKTTYDRESNAAKEEGRDSIYTLESDQNCEGMSLPEAVKAKAAAAA